MKIEILKDVIDSFDDKENTILYFIEDNNIFNDFSLKEDNFCLNDYIIYIKKNNLEVSKIGKIINIDDNISIIYNNKYIININPEDYYIFIKKSKYNNKNQYFIELLNNI